GLGRTSIFGRAGRYKTGTYEGKRSVPDSKTPRCVRLAGIEPGRLAPMGEREGDSAFRKNGSEKPNALLTNVKARRVPRFSSKCEIPDLVARDFRVVAGFSLVPKSGQAPGPDRR